jgi:hypothetical protein
MKMGYRIIFRAILGMSLLFALSYPVLAAPAWVEGKVTDRQSSGGIHHIQLDGKKVYMLMKDCRIDMRFQEKPGMYFEKPVDFGYVSKGQHITIKAEDDRAYQVLILE